jgi:2-aminoadipate transaminase
LYRQLYAQIKGLIDSGELATGFRLPPTRELAGSLGLNRTTVSAAYELLDSEGLIKGHVGRGSFVSGRTDRPGGFAWRDLLDPAIPNPLPSAHASAISFATSRPSELLFPLDEFRTTCSEVIHGEDAQVILQLGSPAGYAPLRRHLMERARQEGAARESDDILVTSGCQQGFDLLQRILVSHGETVFLEDPVYPGLKNAFLRAGARVIGIAVEADGIDLDQLERSLLREKPRLLVVTPNFQNPTGARMPLPARKALLRLAQRVGVVLVENDIYGELGYAGERLPTLKQLDDSGDVVLLRSFSKLAFPGLRVGWLIGPRALVEKLTETKQWSDLHTDQLSQAILLRFAESGRLEEHRQRMLSAGRERLQAAISACERHLPRGTRFTRPQGGMNLWVRLPEPLDASGLMAAAEREGVTYLPGKYFGVTRVETGSLRLSFAGLPPEKIESGIAILGRIFTSELEQIREHARLEPVPALV